MKGKKTSNKEPSDESIKAFRDSVFENFSEVSDPRRRGKRIRHELLNIFFITLCAILCGANQLKEIATYAKSRQKWLESILKLPYGVPCYSTFWLVFALLNPEKFQQGFVKWVSSLTTFTKGRVLAIDGKALRGTAVTGEPNSFIHMVSLWACDEALTLGQVKVDDKSNEITAIPKLLEMFDIEGAIITIDAMGTQGAIAKQIIKGKGDYVLALKGNQSKTHDEVTNFFEQAEAIEFVGVEHSVYHIIEEGHGRSEKRTLFVTEDIEWLPSRGKWEGLRSIVLLISERTIGSTISIERRMYLSSLPADPRRIAYAIRSHWGIENGCHWVLDVSFREDMLRARGGHIAENLSVAHRVALNLLKQDKKTDGGVEIKRKKAAWEPDYLLELLGIKFF